MFAFIVIDVIFNDIGNCKFDPVFFYLTQTFSNLSIELNCNDLSP